MKKIVAFLMLFVVGSGVINAMDYGFNPEEMVENLNNFKNFLKTVNYTKNIKEEISEKIKNFRKKLESLLPLEVEQKYLDLVLPHGLVENLCIPCFHVCGFYYNSTSTQKHFANYGNNSTSTPYILSQTERERFHKHHKAFKEIMTGIKVLHKICTYYLSEFNNAEQETDRTIRKIIFLCIEHLLLPSVITVTCAIACMHICYNNCFEISNMLNEKNSYSNLIDQCTKMSSDLETIIESEKEKK